MLEKRDLYTCTRGRQQSQRNTPSPKTIHNYMQNGLKFHDPSPPLPGPHNSMTPKTNIQKSQILNVSVVVQCRSGVILTYVLLNSRFLA